MKLHIKDPGSAITHFIGMVLAFFSAFPLLVEGSGGARKTSRSRPGYIHCQYDFTICGKHRLPHPGHFPQNQQDSEENRPHDDLCAYRRDLHPGVPDHPGRFHGWHLLALVWTIAAVGILIKAFWVTCPKWFSSVIYIAMAGCASSP